MCCSLVFLFLNHTFTKGKEPDKLFEWNGNVNKKCRSTDPLLARLQIVKTLQRRKKYENSHFHFTLVLRQLLTYALFDYTFFPCTYETNNILSLTTTITIANRTNKRKSSARSRETENNTDTHTHTPRWRNSDKFDSHAHLKMDRRRKTKDRRTKREKKCVTDENRH